MMTLVEMNRFWKDLLVNGRVNLSTLYLRVYVFWSIEIQGTERTTSNVKRHLWLAESSSPYESGWLIPIDG